MNIELGKDVTFTYEVNGQKLFLTGRVVALLGNKIEIEMPNAILTDKKIVIKKTNVIE